MICRVGFHCRTALKTEPETDRSFNSGQLKRWKISELFEELRSRDRHNTLSIKNTRAQKTGFDIHFESRRTGACRVWDDGHKRSILLFEMDAEDQARSHLDSKPEVN